MARGGVNSLFKILQTHLAKLVRMTNGDKQVLLALCLSASHLYSNANKRCFYGTNKAMLLVLLLGDQDGALTSNYTTSKLSTQDKLLCKKIKQVMQR